MDGVKCTKFLSLVSISVMKEIKVNNLTPDYGQNLIYPLVVLKFVTKEPKLF